MRESIGQERARATKPKISAGMIVRDPDPLADERGERLGNPVRSLQVEMNDLKIRVPKQAGLNFAT